MARENLVTLTGPVIGKQIRYNDDRNPIKGTIILATCTRGLGTLNKGVEPRYRSYQIPVVSRNERIIEKLENVGINDVVYIKGVVYTRNMINRHICENCGSIEDKPVTRAFVVPIDFIILKDHIEAETAKEFTKAHAEFSNEVNIIGNICVGPKRIGASRQSPLEYQLAVSRTYRIAEDGEETKTDYPWVVCYGQSTYMDEEVLQVSSQIMVNGFLKTREFLRHFECSECGEKFSIKCQAMEITPYHVEYLRNCNIPETEDPDSEEVEGNSYEYE